MKGSVWIDRTAAERAVLAFLNNRRDPKFSVALHIRRCEGDDRDYELMYDRQSRNTLRYGIEGTVVAGSGQTPKSWWCWPL